MFHTRSGRLLCRRVELIDQYESQSKRFIPEAVDFVGSAIQALMPRKKGTQVSKLYPTLRSPTNDLTLSSTCTAEASDTVDFPSLMTADDRDSEQRKVEAVSVALRLVSVFATLYSSLDAFIEIFTPIQIVLETSRLPKASPTLKVSNLYNPL